MSARQDVLASALRGLGYAHRCVLFSDGRDGVIMHIPGGYVEISARPDSWHLFASPSPDRPMFKQVDTLNDVLNEVLVRVDCFDLDVDHDELGYYVR